MKSGFVASLLLVAAMLAGCSGIKTPTASLASHDPRHDIPAIDQMIVDMKQDYIQACYMPVAKREPPVNACQTELFQMLERRYHMNYTQDHVDMASNDLFFKDVNTKITDLVRKDRQVGNAARRAFGSTDEMMAYYKEAYKFQTN
jgi:hypothetical protein